MHEFLKVKRELYERASKQIKREWQKEWQRWVYKRLPEFLDHIWKCCHSHKCCIHFLWDIWATNLHEDMEKSDHKHKTSIFQIGKGLRRADSLWCYCMAPSHWHGATSPSLPSPLLKGSSHKDPQGMCRFIKHLWHLYIGDLLSSLPWDLSLTARFIPSSMWIESRGIWHQWEHVWWTRCTKIFLTRERWAPFLNEEPHLCCGVVHLRHHPRGKAEHRDCELCRDAPESLQELSDGWNGSASVGCRGTPQTLGLLLWYQVWFTLLPDSFMVPSMNNKRATINIEKKFFLALQPHKFIVQFSKEFYFT